MRLVVAPRLGLFALRLSKGGKRARPLAVSGGATPRRVTLSLAPGFPLRRRVHLVGLALLNPRLVLRVLRVLRVCVGGRWRFVGGYLRRL